MKQIKTTRFGDIEIDESKILTFKDGIPAFESEHDFVLIPCDEQSPFLFMQSTMTPDLAFLLTSPFVFFPDYELEIDDNTLLELAIKGEDDVLVLSLLTIPQGDFAKMTANLLAPIIINQENHRAKQMVMENSGYTTAHLLKAKEE